MRRDASKILEWARGSFGVRRHVAAPQIVPVAVYDSGSKIVGDFDFVDFEVFDGLDESWRSIAAKP